MSAQASLVTVTQKQSLDLVQIFLCATVSSVAFLRDLFPDDCFERRHYDTESSQGSYTEFMNSRNNETYKLKKPNPKKAGIEWEILLRGKNPHVDKLLDWLELGVSDALAHKYLETLQLCIYDGQVASTNIVETYTMTFSFSTKPGDINMALTVQGNNDNNHLPELGVAKEDLRRLLYKLITIVQNFPDLPLQRMLSMHLTYNATCPVNYQPTGFRPSDDIELIVGHKGASVGRLDTGIHQVGLHYFTMGVHERTEAQAEPAFWGESPIPDDSILHGLPAGDEPLENQDTATTIDVNEPIETGKEQDNSPESDKRKLVTFRNVDRNLLTSQLLDSLLSMPESDIPQQSQLLENKPAANIQFSQAVINRMIFKNGYSPATNGDGSLASGNHSVRCECDAKFEDQNMAQCQSCGELQHLACYGYLSDDTALPPLHFCYTCLLGQEPNLFIEMKQMCRLRRLLKIVTDGQCPSTEGALARSLGCNVENMRRASNMLKDKGLISSAKNTRRKGFANSGKPILELVEVDEKLNLMCSRYFEPSFNIGHLLVSPNTTSDEIEDSYISDDDKIPPQDQWITNHSGESFTEADAPKASADFDLENMSAGADVSSTMGTPSTVHVPESPSNAFNSTELPETPVRSAGGRKKRKLGHVTNPAAKFLRAGTANSPFALMAPRVSSFTSK